MATDVKYATQEKSVKVRNVLLVVFTNISKVTLSKLSNNIQVHSGKKCLISSYICGKCQLKLKRSIMSDILMI